MLGLVMGAAITFAQVKLGVLKIEDMPLRLLALFGPYVALFVVAYLVHVYHAVWKLDQARCAYIATLHAFLDDFMAAGRFEVLADEADQLRVDLVHVAARLRAMSPSDLQLNQHLSKQRSDLDHAYATHRTRAAKYRLPILHTEVLDRYIQLPNRDWDELALIIDRHKYALKSLSEAMSKRPINSSSIPVSKSPRPPSLLP